MRVSGLALSQWAQLLGAGLAAIVFGVYLSPLPTAPTIWLSVFVAGLPVAVSYGAMGLDFSVADFAAAAWRWRKGERRYLAGAGNFVRGYRIVHEPPATAPPRPRLEVGPSEDAWDF